MVRSEGVSTAVAVIVTAIIVAAVVAGITYAVVPKGGVTTTTIVKTVTSTTTKTVGAPGAKTVTVTTTKTVTATVTTSVTPTMTKTVTATATTPKVIKKVKAAVIIRKRGDLGFNDMAWLGGQMAAEKLGAKVDYYYYENIPQAQYYKFLEDIVKKGYDIIVVVNFMMADQVAKLSEKYPNQKFAIVDAVVPNRPNVLSIIFKENEGSALVGALAAYLTKTNVVGIVLGMDIPPLWKFEIGFKWGVHYVMNQTGKKIKILWEYVGTFGDPNKGKEAAMLMLQQGADVIYHAAGETGLGVLDAVYEWDIKHMGQHALAIGVDAPQAWVHPGYIIASMVKHVDVAVYKAIEEVATGTFKGGLLVLGLKEGGVDISKPEDIKKMIDIAVSLHLMSKDKAQKVYNEIMKLRNSIPKDIWDKVMKLRQEIIEGKIKVPMPTKQNIKELRKIYG